MDYEISRYTRFVPVSDNAWLVHNLMSGSEAVLSQQEKEILEHIGSGTAQLSPENLEAWFSLGFLVRRGVDEEACLELQRKMQMYRLLTDHFGIIIAPTMDCNARCFYCYENEQRARCYMSPQAEQALVAYIKSMALGKKTLFVSWFGGEPLLCADLIDRVSAELIAFCEENSIRYDAELTTNGILASRYANRFQNWGIRDTQISLDGFAEQHEKRKNYVHIQNVWEKTINGIFACAEQGGTVTLRMNFDRSNVDGLLRTAEMLLNDPRWNESVSIYFYPLEPAGGDASAYYSEDEYKEMYDYIYQRMFDMGYYRNRESALSVVPLVLPCYSASLSTVAVDWSGKLYRCQHLLCRDGYAIGDVYNGILITESLLRWYDGTLPDTCSRCSVLPLCQGGCLTKRCLGQSKYLCHIMKYRIGIQERLRARILKEELQSME